MGFGSAEGRVLQKGASSSWGWEWEKGGQMEGAHGWGAVFVSGVVPTFGFLVSPLFSLWTGEWPFLQSTGGKHKARGRNLTLHLVLSARHVVSTQLQR